MATASRRNTRNSYRGDSYRRNSYRTQGSLALVPMPKYAPMQEERNGIEEEIRKRNRKNRKVSIGYVAYMILCMGILTLVCANYLKLQSEVTLLNRSTARLENNLLDATLSNDEEYARIMGAVDIERIKQIAMEDLGMTYPDESQVVSFVDNDSDYVRQFGEIPD